MTATDWVVVTESGQDDRIVAIAGRLFVGRKLGSAGGAEQVLLDDPAISRAHLELRNDEAGGVVLVDQSTNGTRVNGERAAPGEPVTLRDGDLIEAGSARLGFRSLEHPLRIPEGVRAAIRMTEPTLLAVVVGDVVASEDGGESAGARDALFAALRELLADHGATARGVAGDSLFAAWDATDHPDAAARAVAFALAAGEIVPAPLRMGWGVTVGDATEAHTSTTCQAVHREAVNLAFRLAALAAGEGDGGPAVLVAAQAADAAPAAARYGDPRDVDLRGRPAPVDVRAAA